MAKRKSKISDILEERSSSRSQRSKASLHKMFGIMIGVALTLSAIWIISAVSVSFAQEDVRNYMMSGMMPVANNQEIMMSDAMPDNEMSGNMMHSMMMGGNGMSKCMKMMNQAMDDGKITQEEMEEMMGQMDKDGDGLCDYCGMSVEMCRRMMG